MWGVLVAISIPIFTSQLEKSREATDEANLRSIYAELSADVLTEDTSKTSMPGAASYSITKDATTGKVTGEATYEMKQQTDGTASGQAIEIGGFSIASGDFKTGTATIKVYGDGTAPSITFA